MGSTLIESNGACQFQQTIPSFKHPRLNQLAKYLGPLGFSIPIWWNVDRAILYAVIGQMLSTQASGSIIKGLLKKFRSSKKIIKWASLTAEKKGPICGVSQRKRKALRAWSDYVKDNPKPWRKWAALPLHEFRAEIKSIWGFGDWAADMLAIFYLGRDDVWPENDAGITKMSKLIFNTSEKKCIQDAIKGQETLTALYFWKCINQKYIPKFN